MDRTRIIFIAIVGITVVAIGIIALVSFIGGLVEEDETADVTPTTISGETQATPVVVLDSPDPM